MIPFTTIPRVSQIVQLLWEQDVVAQSVLELDLTLDRMEPLTPAVSESLAFVGHYRDIEQERYNEIYAELEWVKEHCPVLLDTARLVYKRMVAYDFR